MSKEEELISQLSADEQRSFREISRGPARRRIPFDHAETLIRLGLVELVCGYQELTARGKRVKSLIGT